MKLLTCKQSWRRGGDILTLNYSQQNANFQTAKIILSPIVGQLLLKSFHWPELQSETPRLFCRFLTGREKRDEGKNMFGGWRRDGKQRFREVNLNA